MSTGRFWTRTIPFWGFHGSSDVLQTLLVAPASWFQDGGAGNDVNQNLWRVFRSHVAVAQDGGPSASGRHLGWPHFRKFREWGHPRWRPEAEGPPSCATATMGVEKLSLYYSDWPSKITTVTPCLTITLKSLDIQEANRSPHSREWFGDSSNGSWNRIKI